MNRKFRPNIEVLEDRSLPAIGLQALGSPLLTTQPQSMQIQQTQHIVLSQQVVNLAKISAPVPAPEPSFTVTWIDKLGGIRLNHNQTLARQRRRNRRR